MTLWPYSQEVTKLAAQVRQLYGSNMKSVSPLFLHLTGLDTNGRVYRECVRQSLDFNKLMVGEQGLIGQCKLKALFHLPHGILGILKRKPPGQF